MFFNYCDEKYRDGVAPLECEGTGATLVNKKLFITIHVYYNDSHYLSLLF